MKHYYKTTKGKLFCCDNVEYLIRLADDNIDLTVTSPPYDNLRDYKGYSWDFEALARELYRTTKVGGVVVWVVGDATIKGSETGSSFRQALYFMECGFNLHDTMIYESRKPPLTHNRYEQQFEYMFVFSNGKPKTFNPIKEKTIYVGDKKEYYYNPASSKEKSRAIRQRDTSTNVNKKKIKGNIWKYATGMNGSTKDKVAFNHPAIFPEKLAYDHIISWSNENDLIFDPFMGSGTTAKMCERSNRKWIGCEISEEYCEITKQRIENEINQIKLDF